MSTYDPCPGCNSLCSPCLPKAERDGELRSPTVEWPSVFVVKDEAHNIKGVFRSRQSAVDTKECHVDRDRWTIDEWMVQS